ncbi:hypothetical protein [uncultured Muribaculum sp.]|uniref:hypothetical protein n=1 Tax=uncultured Muribaculum sp. TaxID=1918613 RepID=UPI0025B1DC90|nr:hypothetical protein [uncultured Muribaculum sp.]
MAVLQYDDKNLFRMFDALDTKQRLKALKGAFRREANKVRKTAINNLRGSGIRTAPDMERGIRAIVFRRKVGFRVTIGTKAANKKTGKGEKGMHLNRQGLKKPVLIWAEGGTSERRTKNQTSYFTWSRKGHRTGRMKRYGFMSKTENQVRGTVTQSLHEEIINNIQRIAKKYGCT